jgi:asparagine synthase (glutamine-hydrolysing)
MRPFFRDRPTPKPPKTWHLAWGNLTDITNASWQDDRFAVFAGDRSQLPLTLSPNQRFVIIGDVWLSDRSTILTDRDDRSDLQTIALAWEKWETATLEKLVGSFALAVWDRDRQELYLSRDGSGTRNLYYTNAGSTRWISPTLRTLAPFHSRTLDSIALRDYLCCSFVPGERTMWAGVSELRPGTLLSWPLGRIDRYWQLESHQTTPSHPATLVDAGQQLRHLLGRVVSEYLPPPGQPVGCFLSGGLDSSCITALAAQLHSGQVHTYSIHFGVESPNELEFSGLVANHCGTQHHILEITFDQMWKELPETMAWLDDPIGDPLTVPNLLLGRLARQQVGIVLNGEGGDPCFGGPKNQPMLLQQIYGKVNDVKPLDAYLRSFQKCALDLPQLLQPDLWLAVRDAEMVFAEDLLSPGDYLNRLMTLNIKFKGSDQILTKVNNLTQAAGIEGRSPLFDRRVVEMSMGIPPEFKLSGVREKAVLKQAVADLLPLAITDRPKSGMMVPVQLGFKKYWHRQAKHVLLDRHAQISPYLDRSLIKDWLDYNNDPWQRYGVKLWLLLSLELWLQGQNQNHS